MEHPERPPERLNPLNDYLFFKVMGEKGDEQQLLGFLNAVLRRGSKTPIISLEIIENKTFTAEVTGDKTSVLDIRAVLEDGTKVNVEVQLRNYGNMDKRSLFYWSREYTRSLEQGQDYNELPNVVAINIVNFEFLPSGGFQTTFHLWEDHERGLMLTDALEIHFLDMVKFRTFGGKDLKNDPLHRWLTWFDQDSPAELVEEVIQMDKAIELAEARAAYVTSDKEALRAYEMRQMALSDWTSGVNHARREGLKEGLNKGLAKGLVRGKKEGLAEGKKEGLAEGKKEGLAEGKKEGLAEGKKEGLAEGKKEIARNLKALGTPVGQIAQATGLSEAEITRL